VGVISEWNKRLFPISRITLMQTRLPTQTRATSADADCVPFD